MLIINYLGWLIDWFVCWLLAGSWTCGREFCRIVAFTCPLPSWCKMSPPQEHFRRKKNSKLNESMYHKKILDQNITSVWNAICNWSFSWANKYSRNAGLSASIIYIKYTFNVGLILTASSSDGLLAEVFWGFPRL